MGRSNGIISLSASYGELPGINGEAIEFDWNAGWPARPGPFSFLKTRNGVGMGPFERSGSSKFRCGSHISSPLLPFLGVKKKHQSVSIRKTKWNIQWVDQKCMLFETRFYNAFFFFFENSSTLMFALCFPPSAGTPQTKNGLRGQLSSFFGFSWPILRFRGPKFLFRDVSQNSRVLPRVFCLCGAVGVCGECHGVKWRVNDVFVRCVFERHTSKSHDHCSKKLLSRQRKLWACGPKRCRFSRTSHGCLPTFCDTRESSARNSAGMAGAGCWTSSSCLLSSFHNSVDRTMLRGLVNTWFEWNVACGVRICHQVGHVRQCAIWKNVLICDKFHKRGRFWSKRSRNLLFFQPNFELFLLPSIVPLHFYTTVSWKMKSRCPERREKRWLEISGAQGERATLYLPRIYVMADFSGDLRWFTKAEHLTWDRIIFMSMSNDIDWTSKGNDGICIPNTGIREEILAGTLDVLRSWRRQDVVWNSSWYTCTTRMVERFKDTGHPVFKSISAFRRGILKKKNNSDTIHFNADASHTELLFRIIHSFCESAQYLRSSFELVWAIRLDRGRKGTRKTERIRDERCIDKWEITRSKTFGIFSETSIWKHFAGKHSALRITVRDDSVQGFAKTHQGIG